MRKEQLTLVTPDDRVIGSGEKMHVHKRGLLHRAFSILIFGKQESLLLQQRAVRKYHSQGLWTNTCCGHPRHGEGLNAAAHRRLNEEMGFDCVLVKVHTFAYRARVSRGLIENEIDHIFVGYFEGAVEPNPSEVLAWTWMSIAELVNEVGKKPTKFTVWFKCLLEEVELRGLYQWSVEARALADRTLTRTAAIRP